MLALTAMIVIITAKDTAKVDGPKRLTKESPSTKGSSRGRSATPNRASIGDLKRKAQSEMDEAHADGRATLETKLTQTWEEIQQSAWQRFKGFEDQAWANFNDKTKVEAKDLKALYERMEEIRNGWSHGM